MKKNKTTKYKENQAKAYKAHKARHGYKAYTRLLRPEWFPVLDHLLTHLKKCEQLRKEGKASELHISTRNISIASNPEKKLHPADQPKENGYLIE